MMNHAATLTLSIGVILAAGAATLAAPQTRPGEPTKPSVWVENRGIAEAVPTTIEAMSDSARPLRIEVVGTPAVTLGPTVVVQTRAVRQQWEHRLLTLQPGQDLAGTIAKIESENWEAVGFQATSQGLTAVLLKRPR
jgi:hypothetical protein